jgi:hypothetical protein
MAVEIITKDDLQLFRRQLLDDVKKLLLDNKQDTGRKFYTPKEFCALTGMKYSTVAYRCKVGRLKARQDSPNCSWQIDVTEVARLTREANDNGQD